MALVCPFWNVDAKTREVCPDVGVDVAWVFENFNDIPAFSGFSGLQYPLGDALLGPFDFIGYTLSAFTPGNTTAASKVERPVLSPIEVGYLVARVENSPAVSWELETPTAVSVELVATTSNRALFKFTSVADDPALDGGIITLRLKPNGGPVALVLTLNTYTILI